MTTARDGIITMFSAYTSVFVVMEMKKASQQRRISLIVKVLRLLSTKKGFEEFAGDQEEIVRASVLGKNHCNYLSEIETAWFEVESKRAKALMEWQKRRFIY